MTRLVSIILTLALCAPKAYSEPSDYDVWLGSYKLDVQILEPRKRLKVPQMLLCLDEYDYVYMQTFVTDQEAACKLRLDRAKIERDRICDDSKEQIRKRCEDTETRLKLEISKMTTKFVDKEAELQETIKRHGDEIFKHYMIEGSIALALIGVITVVIAK